MPLPLAALVALALGASFAWIARTELAQEDGPLVSSRPFAIVLAFALFVYTPLLAYFTAFHGDWSYLYLVSWRKVPSAVDLAAVLGCGALISTGFTLAAPFARGRHLTITLTMIGLPLAAASALALLWQHRLGVSASYAQFQGHFGVVAISQAALGRAVLVALTIGAAATTWCGRLLRLSRRRTV
ncbi:hypothetical protein BH09MYX1_BH09MYX1_14600 [soil metagenome]